MKRLVLGGAVAQLVSVLAILVAARSLGAATFAVAATISAVGTTAGAVSSFGVNSHQIRQLAGRNVDLGTLLEEFLGRIGTAAVIASLISLVLMASGVLTAIDVVVVLAVATASQIAQCSTVPLLAAGRYGRVSGASFVDKLAFLCATLVAAKAGCLGPVTFCLAFAGGNVVGAAVAFTSWHSGVPFPIKPAGPVRMWRLYRSSQWVGFAQVSFTAQQLDIPVAHLAVRGVDAGQYAAVARWTQPIVLLAAAAGSTTLRDAAIAPSDRDAVARVASTTMRPFVLASVASAITAVGAYAATPFVLGASYSGSRIPAVILLAGAPFTFISQVALNLLVARHHEKLAGISAATLVTLQLLAVYPLTRGLGSTGPAVASTVMQVAYSGILLYGVRRLWNRIPD